MSQYGHKDCTAKKFYMARRKIGFFRSWCAYYWSVVSVSFSNWVWYDDIECAILELNVLFYLEIALVHFLGYRSLYVIRIVPWRNYMQPEERLDVAEVNVFALWSVVIVSLLLLCIIRWNWMRDHGIECRFCLEIICCFVAVLWLFAIWSSGLSVHPKSTLCILGVPGTVVEWTAF